MNFHTVITIIVIQVIESIQCLQGGGPADLRELVCLEGAILLQEAGLVKSRYYY